MKKILLLFYFACLVSTVFAQKQAYNWYFGILAGMNFSTPTPTILTNGALSTSEGCSSISDTAGNILFYTDGITVWNSQNTPMPNGTGLLAGSSSTQAALIVPQPGNDSIYYVFTTDEAGGVNGFEYSIVNMNLQSGLGDVTSKNNVIQYTVTEKLTAVTTLDNSKTWVVVHEWGSNAFYAYALTASGLNLTPVISNAGIVHHTTIIQDTYGQMKFASCGNKLAAAVGYEDTVEVFDFNLATGTVYNPITIPMPDHVYGVEFSGSGQKLYVTCYDLGGTLVQFDLGAGTLSDILASATSLSTTPDLYGLQLAPDGRIYVDQSFSSYLNVVNDPEMGGTACDYVENAVNLDPNFNGITSALDLPNFVQSYFDQEHKGCTVTSVHDPAQQNELALYPNPADNFIFLSGNFGSGNTRIQLFDVTGQERINLHGDSETPSPWKIDIGSLEEGIYLLKVQGEEKSFMQKVIVNRQ